MAIQVLPPRPKSGWSLIAEAAGEGLEQGLNSRMRHNRNMSALKAYQEAPDAISKARALISMDPQDRSAFLDALKTENEAAQSRNALSSLFGDQQYDDSPANEVDRNAVMQQLQQPQQTPLYQQDFSANPYAQEPEPIPVELEQDPQLARMQQMEEEQQMPIVPQEEFARQKPRRQVPNDPTTWSDDTVVKARAFKNHKDPALRQIANVAEAEAQRREKDQKKKIADEKIKNKNIETYRKEISDYAKPYADQAPLKKNVHDLEEAQKLIENGKVSLDERWLRNAATAILENNESQFANFTKSKEQQKLFSLLRGSLKAKEEGGSNPSTREVMISMSAIPSIFKQKEANEYIVGQFLINARANLERSKAINEIRRKNPSISPEELSHQVEQRVDNFIEVENKNLKSRLLVSQAKDAVKTRKKPAGHTWMVREDNGEIYPIPNNKVKEMMSKGGVVVK